VIATPHIPPVRRPDGQEPSARQAFDVVDKRWKPFHERVLRPVDWPDRGRWEVLLVVGQVRELDSPEVSHEDFASPYSIGFDQRRIGCT
jgi:hypothetical protein